MTAKLAAVGLVVAAWGSAGADPMWWNRRWEYRRAIDVAPNLDAFDALKMRGEDRQAAGVSFLTFGKARRDGGDMRVVGPDGKVRPSVLFGVGPGDVARVGFAVTGRRAQRYYVYFGNPDAEAPSGSWRPETGLLLETYAYAGGALGTVEAIKNTIAKSKAKLIGRAFVPTIFTPWNRFGDQKETCNFYRGFLICRQAGTYRFALSSWDGSCLFVDGQLVVAWPGRHRWVGDVRHQGSIALGAGVHELELYHVNLSGEGGVSVGWTTGGDKQFRIIPPNDFLPVAQAKAGPLESRGKSFVPDFSYDPKSFSMIHERPIFLYEFRPSHPPGTRRAEFTWAFGDGQKMKAETAQHLFLRKGLYDVALTVTAGTRSWSSGATIHVGPNPGDLQGRGEKLHNYLPALSTYDFTKLTINDLLAVMDLYQIVGRSDLAIAAGQAFSMRSAPPESVHRWATTLAKLLIEYQAGYASAATVYEDAITKVPAASTLRYELTSRAVDVLVNNLGEIGRAEQLLRRPGMPTTQPAEKLPTELLIAWGDVFRFRGRRDLAERFYGLAQATVKQDEYFARSGGYAAAIEDYLRRREYAAAGELIDHWQRQFPLQKLGDYSCYLLYRLYLAQDRREQAQRLAELLGGIDPMGFYARKMAAPAEDKP